MSEYIVEFGYEPTPTNTPELPIGEKITRCRDCAKLDNGWLCAWCAREVEPDGFCAWAVRRDG